MDGLGRYRGGEAHCLSSATTHRPGEGISLTHEPRFQIDPRRRTAASIRSEPISIGWRMSRALRVSATGPCSAKNFGVLSRWRSVPRKGALAEEGGFEWSTPAARH